MTEDSNNIDSAMKRLNPVPSIQLQKLVNESDTTQLLNLLANRRKRSIWRIRIHKMLSRFGLGLVIIITSAGAAAASNGHDTYSAADNAACQPVKVYSQPPANFDALTASNADLSTYGLPPRPPGDNAGALATWSSMVANAKSYSAPQPVCSTDTRTDGSNI